jgi:hypothetical protein
MASPTPIDHSLDDQSRVPEIIGILAFCSVLSTLAVGLRVYTRWHLIHAFGVDDGTMVVAQVGMIVAKGYRGMYQANDGD